MARRTGTQPPAKPPRTAGPRAEAQGGGRSGSEAALANAEQLAAARDFLADHARDCLEAVEAWMLRSLAVPRGVIEAVLADEAWRAVLVDAWVVPVSGAGEVDPASGGLLRAAEARGLGVVDRDGETAWLDAAMVMVPHPALLEELDELRGFAVELGVTQGISQLFREVFAGGEAAGDGWAVDRYAGGEFGALGDAIARAKQLGYRVSGGAALCRVLERGRMIEARFELGSGDPVYETATGELGWLDERRRSIAVADVPPIAFSEGMRMAAQIYAGRRVEREGGDD